MKRLILISALLFSFNGWAEMLAFECKETFTAAKDGTPLRLDPAPKFVTINPDKKIWYQGSLELELFSDPTGTFYSAAFGEEGDSFFYQNTLNRLTGEVTLETPATYFILACKAAKPLW